MIKLKKVFHFIGLLSFSTLLIGCQHQARVDRWVEVPCQPHGFFIAFKGQSLADVAKICQIDEALLTQHNAWLTKRQPFTENTVVWLRTDPNAPIVEADLTVKGIDNATSPGFAAESLTPLVLPNRVVPAKPSVPRSSVR